MSPSSPCPSVLSITFADDETKWQTTWDQSRLFTNVGVNTTVNFKTPGAVASANIQIDDDTYFQVMAGHGASLSGSLGVSSVLSREFTDYAADSSAKLLDQLKVLLCSKLVILNPS